MTEEPRSKRVLITDHFKPTMPGQLDLNNKKEYNTSFVTEAPSLRRPSPPDEIQASLLNVGMRARKAVTDGYKFSTSLPSYRGNTIGPLTYASFNESPYAQQAPMLAGRSATVGDLSAPRLKRARDDEEEEKVPTVLQNQSAASAKDNSRRVFYAPSEPSLMRTNSVVDDFEEAEFLRDSNR